ncbi:MAG TPA: DoxX family protein [Rhodocyclaceae bacterium]|nr:DoxX family protein [Rhodocyclaceae bacterium]
MALNEHGFAQNNPQRYSIFSIAGTQLYSRRTLPYSLSATLIRIAVEIFGERRMNNNYVHLAGRIGLASLFLASGFLKLQDPAGTASYLKLAGLPELMTWPIMALELLGGAAILLGFKTRIAAYALAVFTMAGAIYFTHDITDPTQLIELLKSASITGGLLLLASTGATFLGINPQKASRKK